MSYQSAKAGKAWGAAAPEYDDTNWRIVNLPHDWAVESSFDPRNNLSQGYRARGIGWYRRFVRLDPADRGKSFELKFDGVSTNCTVWINGNLMKRSWSGYTSFSIDLTPLANFGDQLNSIVVRVDADAMEGWWYEGAGIYRHTWLIVRPPVHFITDGVYACPIRNKLGSWTLPIESTITNDGKIDAEAKIAVKLVAPTGEIVREIKSSIVVAPLNTVVAIAKMSIERPRLWSLEDPSLYQVVSTVTVNNRQDENVVNCGFRTIRFDVNKGFFLNDSPLKIKGTANHQDFAGVGVAVPDSIWDFRIRKLKEMGSNSYRCAHNPPAKEFLDACDRLGMLVMDENRDFNISDESLRQLSWMVRRDRNHPSIILWSVLNEEPLQGTEVGYQMVRRMSAVVKSLDSTRPVSAAMNGGLDTVQNVSDIVDVVGLNYQHEIYDEFHKQYPSKKLISSEDTSAFMSRGVYQTNDTLHEKDSYDDQYAAWGWSHRKAWEAIAERPFIAGGFTWTGFDYRGEPSPYEWPSVSSLFGCMDLCGFPKAAFYMHQAFWIEDKPMLHLIPHWNWKGKEGQSIQVMAITNADSVNLILNGKAIGKKAVDDFATVSWNVPYEPGKLEAVAIKDGKEVARTSVETTGVAVALEISPDRDHLNGDGQDAEPITVSAVDRSGREVPTVTNLVTFTIDGPASSIGVGNGDSNSHEPEKGVARSLYEGLAQIIIQSKRNSSGIVTIKASSPGLKDGVAQVTINQVNPEPSVPPTEMIFNLVDWKVSPCFKQRPDPNSTSADNDMNSWTTIQPGSLQDFKNNSWALYRTQFLPLQSVQQQGGKIQFKGIVGKAEIWLDGKQIGTKDNPALGDMTLAIPAGPGQRTLTLLVNSQGLVKAGLSGNISLLE